MSNLGELADRYAASKRLRPCPLCGDTEKPKVNVTVVVRELRADRKGAGKTKVQKGRTVCERCAARVFVTSVEAMGYATTPEEKR